MKARSEKRKRRPAIPPRRTDPLPESAGTVSAPEVAGPSCLLDRPSDPCALVILGASGDLTSRKLVPALFNLHLKGGLPERFLLVGCGRTTMTDDEFRSRLKAMAQKSGHDVTRWNEFAPMLRYRRLEYEKGPSYLELEAWLKSAEEKAGTLGNRILYLALPMFLYETVAGYLGREGLGGEAGRAGWTRVVVEKPFGSDRSSAAQLDRALHSNFAEEQIFRIDHYLAKETVQNLLMFRFANLIFEPLWNRNHIRHVSIVAAETGGVERRAGYYEKAGVLRDMFQNHMMQLLALTAMEPPNRFTSDSVGDEKIRVFSALRPFPTDRLFENMVLGQYGRGAVDGREVRGYREEEGVDPGSVAPTFGLMRVFVDNWRWQGVPFFLASGKRLSAPLTEISITFRPAPVSMFQELLGATIEPNVLTLCIHPQESIRLQFLTKSPGAKVCLRTVTMDFDYLQGYAGPVLEAYEKALLDCMHGDRMLFWRQDGIDRTWAYFDPVLKACETCRDRGAHLHTYAAGSAGPVAAAVLKRKMLAEC